MNRPIACCLSITAAAILALPALTSATPQIGEKSNGLSITDEKYLHVYVDCWDAFKAQCGRNIVDDGLASGNPPSEARVQRSIDTMDSWLRPPAPVEGPAAYSPTAVVAPAPATTVAPISDGACGGTTPYAGGGSCWAIPYEIVACESGGSYTASNASGAYGAYQLMPEHGCGTSAAEQDACAAELYAGGAGRSNWVC